MEVRKMKKETMEVKWMLEGIDRMKKIYRRK